MVKSPRITPKASRIMPEEMRIMLKAPNKMSFDHLRQLWLSIQISILAVFSAVNIFLTCDRDKVGYNYTKCVIIHLIFILVSNWSESTG
jgi:hypothetical protein